MVLKHPPWSHLKVSLCLKIQNKQKIHFLVMITCVSLLLLWGNLEVLFVVEALVQKQQHLAIEHQLASLE